MDTPEPSTEPTFPVPLAGLPSLLALRDARRRVKAALGRERLHSERLTQLLALDPPTVLRCLRAYHAPLHAERATLVSVPDLVRRLGIPFVKHALRVPAAHPAGSTGLRALWLHSVLTGLAARDLAAGEGLLDPGQAYLLGLLHDPGAWAREVARWRGQPIDEFSTTAWIARWHLPLELGAGIGSEADDRVLELLRRARELAGLAGFRDPRVDGAPASSAPRVASMDDLVHGARLRAELETLLGRYGLLASLEPMPAAEDSALPLDDVLFPNKSVGRIAELCVNLTAGQRNAKTGALLTASTSAALRYLDFDRAYAVRWVVGAEQCWIRQKADLTPRPLTTQHVSLNRAERDLFAAALATGRPRLAAASECEGRGLLAMLGADEALFLPLNSSFQVPTVLVLDRTLSGVRVDLRRDGAGADALGSIVGLLQENLLLNRARARAVKFSLTDPLTRLSNRGVGVNTLRQEIARSNRTGSPLTVLMLDLDRFKHLNDEFGHVVGDQALRSAGEVLRRSTRRMDTVVRYGGEEFLVILPATGLDEAAVIATRIQTAIEAAGTELNLPITVSIGLATCIQGEDTVETVLSRADRALYASKGRGRNRFSIDVEGALPA